MLPATDSKIVSGRPTYKRANIWQWAQGTAPIDTADPAARMRFAKYSNPVEYEIAKERQDAGKVNQNPVAVERVAAKRVRERRHEAVTEAANGDSQ